MAITRVTCPSCDVSLKLGRPPSPGRRIKCPRCDARIAAPAYEEPDPDVADSKPAEEPPRKRRRKAKQARSSPALLWGLIGGGVAVGILGVVLALVLFGRKKSDPAKEGPQQAEINKLLPGTWETVGPGKKTVVEFTSGGKVHPSGDLGPLAEFRFAKPLKMYADFGIRPGRSLDISYRCLGEGRLEIRGDYTALLEKLSAGGTQAPPPEVVKEYTPTEALTYAVTEKELTLTSDQGKILRLRRAQEPTNE